MQHPEETPLTSFKFKATKQELMEIARKGRERDDFCEELYYIEQLGGRNLHYNLIIFHKATLLCKKNWL